MTFSTGIGVGLFVGCIFGMVVAALMISAKKEELCPRCCSGMIKETCSWCGYEVGDKVSRTCPRCDFEFFPDAAEKVTCPCCGNIVENMPENMP